MLEPVHLHTSNDIMKFPRIVFDRIQSEFTLSSLIRKSWQMYLGSPVYFGPLALVKLGGKQLQ